MTDVARLAGVSHQTVSRVLNDHPNVKQQTRLRVLAAMQELGYRPNRAARALASGRSDQIGIVAQPTNLFGPASLLYAVEAAAVHEGYGVSVASVAALDRASIEDAVNRHLDQQVGGIVVIVPVVSAAEAIREVPADKPLVAIGGDRNEAITSVGIDQVQGAIEATQTLLDAGHRTVWHVSGPRMCSTAWIASRGGGPPWSAPEPRSPRSSRGTGRRPAATKRGRCWPESAM